MLVYGCVAVASVLLIRAAVTNPPPVRPAAAAPPAGAPGVSDRGYTYIHDEVTRVPWSVHVVKAARNRADLQIDTSMGHGTALGIAVVSQQMQLVPAGAGRPVAAINGDMFQSSYVYAGDPDGLQIVRGELVSGPHPSRVCFWVDGQGELHRTNVLSRFEVTWPNGTKMPLGLNEERETDMAVLYTAAIGPTTRTRGGREFVLARQTNSPWLPLQAGTNYTAQVRAMNETGNTRLQPNTMVLSVGYSLLSHLPRITNGAIVRISTATLPDLAGARTAVGGGPTLVSGGKPWHWPGFFQLRHPRSAIGWNKDYFFMVEVDGRQMGSIGMTFAELANYMIKLGCQEAINLDGGGSATLWVDGEVVNRPSEGYERAAANAVVLLQKPRN
jgi:hypothetical protein